jgi:hypothetical protein
LLKNLTFDCEDTPSGRPVLAAAIVSGVDEESSVEPTYDEHRPGVANI